jgi:hypothetical protein
LVDLNEEAIKGSSKQAKQKAKALADAAKLTQSSSDFKDTVRAEILEDSLAHAEAILPTRGWEAWGAGLLGGVGCAAPILMFGFMAVSSEYGLIFLSMAVTVLVFFFVTATVDNYAKSRVSKRNAIAEHIFDEAFLAAVKRFYDRQYDAREGVQTKLGIGSLGSLPSRQDFGVSHQGAERLCADWMKYLGASEVEVTQLTGDGGIDVVAASYIAQVKNYAGTVPINDVRALAGVVHTDGRKGLFFTSGSYSTGAVSFANDAGIALFVYSAEQGTLNGANSMAGQILETGL